MTGNLGFVSEGQEHEHERVTGLLTTAVGLRTAPDLSPTPEWVRDLLGPPPSGPPREPHPPHTTPHPLRHQNTHRDRTYPITHEGSTAQHTPSLAGFRHGSAPVWRDWRANGDVCLGLSGYDGALGGGDVLSAGGCALPGGDDGPRAPPSWNDPPRVDTSDATRITVPGCGYPHSTVTHPALASGGDGGSRVPQSWEDAFPCVRGTPGPDTRPTVDEIVLPPDVYPLDGTVDDAGSFPSWPLEDPGDSLPPCQVLPRDALFDESWGVGGGWIGAGGMNHDPHWPISRR
jgi:hypothetical protein